MSHKLHNICKKFTYPSNYTKFKKFHKIGVSKKIWIISFLLCFSTLHKTKFPYTK